MPDTLTILSGIAMGAEQAASNIYNISQAQQKLKQERELFGLKKKQYKLDIQKAEYEMSPENLAIDKKLRDIELKKDEADLEEKETIVTARKSEEQRKLKDYQEKMRMSETLRPDIFAPEEVRGAAGGQQSAYQGAIQSLPYGTQGPPAIPSMPYEPRPGEEISYEVGGIKGKVKGLDAQERARERIEQKVLKGEDLTPQENKLYYGFQKDISLEELERSFGISGGATKVTLPSNIKTTTQARDWLMKSKGMSEDEAIEWIRSQ